MIFNTAALVFDSLLNKSASSHHFGLFTFRPRPYMVTAEACKWVAVMSSFKPGKPLLTTDNHHFKLNISLFPSYYKKQAPLPSECSDQSAARAVVLIRSAPGMQRLHSALCFLKTCARRTRSNRARLGNATNDKPRQFVGFAAGCHGAQFSVKAADCVHVEIQCVYF